MFSRDDPRRAGAAAPLAAGVFALAACSSSGSTSAAIASVSPVPTGALPYWASTLGSGGTVCSPSSSPACSTNNDPADVFSTAKSFSTIWSNALKQTSSYSLTPCVKVGGKWYVYSPTS